MPKEILFESISAFRNFGRNPGEGLTWLSSYFFFGFLSCLGNFFILSFYLFLQLT